MYRVFLNSWPRAENNDNSNSPRASRREIKRAVTRFTRTLPGLRSAFFACLSYRPVGFYAFFNALGFYRMGIIGIRLRDPRAFNRVRSKFTRGTCGCELLLREYRKTRDFIVISTINSTINSTFTVLVCCIRGSFPFTLEEAQDRLVFSIRWLVRRERNYSPIRRMAASSNLDDDDFPPLCRSERCRDTHCN